MSCRIELCEKARKNGNKNGIWSGHALSSSYAILFFRDIYWISQKHGVQIPDEVAIACISGTDLCVLVHPSITAVEQPVKQMAEEAARLIVQKVEHPELPDKTIILEAETIYREST